MDKIEQAKSILRDAGYFVDNLWSVEDVKSIYKCDNDVAQEILNDALTNDGTMGQIWFAINFRINEYIEENN
jgi:hypothetical protein